MEPPEPAIPTRPHLGGRQFLTVLLATRVAVALRLPLATRLLDRLWFTPWVATKPRPRPNGASTVHVRVDAGVLAGWAVGSGPTVLLVHGWGGAANDLAAVGTALARAGYRAVAVDLPGHGASPDGRGNLYDWARWLRQIADGVGPVDGIVAHSLGSVASYLAVADGLQVPRLVLVAPPSRLAHAVHQFVAQTSLGAVGEMRLRAHLERVFGPQVWEELDVATTAKHLRGADVLVVHDRDDPQVPVDEGERVAAALGGRLVITDGLGHGRVLGAPQVLDEVIRHLTVGDASASVTAPPAS